MKTLTKTAVLGTCALCAASFLAPIASAKDLFTVSLTETNNTTNAVTAGGGSLFDLVENVIKSRDQFASFKDANFTGTLDYLGVPSAISVSANGGAVTLDIPSIHYKRTFGKEYSRDRDAVFDDVLDWLTKGDGIGVYSKFLKEMAKQSLLTINDGSPNATTARAATRSFFHLGFSPMEDLFTLPLESEDKDTKNDSTTPTNKDEKTATPITDSTAENRYYSGLALQFSGGNFKIGDYKGNYADFSIPWRAHCSRRIDLAMDFNFNATTLEKASIYGFGWQLALPIHIIKGDARGDRWNWRVTPFAGADLRASYDLLDGAGIAMAGAASSLDFRVLDWFALSLANQLSYHKSIAIPIGSQKDNVGGEGGYYGEASGTKSSQDFDPEIAQLLLKNGIRASFRPCTWFLGSISASHTNFLKEAKMKSYTTISAAIALKPLRDWRLQLSVNYDFAKDYTATSATVASVWNF